MATKKIDSVLIPVLVDDVTGEVLWVKTTNWVTTNGNNAFTWINLFWATASLTDFPNAQAIFSKDNTGESHIYNTWFVWEATADWVDTTKLWVWWYWAGRTNWATRWVWLMWDWWVTASADTWSAIWVRWYANNTHSWWLNIALYCNASWSGVWNYALQMEAGDINSVTAQTWFLWWALTFSWANLWIDWQSARSFTMARNTTASSAWNNFTIQAGWATVWWTNLAWWNLFLSSWIPTGTWVSYMWFLVSNGT